MSQQQERSGLDWLGLALAGWPLIVAGIVLGLLVAGAITVAQERTFGAVATVVVSPAQGFLDPENAETLPDVTGTIARLSETPAVLGPAGAAYASLAGDTETRLRRRALAKPEWLRDHAGTEQVADTSLIEIQGSAGSQDEATDLASAVASSLTGVVNSARRAGGEPQAGIRARMFALEPLDRTAPMVGANLLLGATTGLVLGTIGAVALGARRRGRGLSLGVVTQGPSV